MNHVLIEKSPSPSKIDVLGAEAWPLKKLAAGRHTHTYAASEDCYVTEGEAVLSCATQTAETVADGDLIFIPQGLTVTWEVAAEVEYRRREHAQA